MFGTLAVGDGQAEGGFPRQEDVGEIHRVEDVAVLQVAAHLLGDHDGAVLLRFDRRGPKVGQGHDAGMAFRGCSGKSQT
jgi:hypothetical protein